MVPLPRPALSCLLIFTLVLLSASSPAQVEAATRSPLTHIHGSFISSNGTGIVDVPGVGGDPLAFGTIGVFDEAIRTGAALDSTVPGELGGTFTTMMDRSIFLDLSFVFNTPSYKGTLTAQIKGIGLFGQREGDCRWDGGLSLGERIVQAQARCSTDFASSNFLCDIYLRYD